MRALRLRYDMRVWRRSLGWRCARADKAMRAFKLLHAGALACAVAVLAVAPGVSAQPPSAPLRFKEVLIKPSILLGGSAGKCPPLSPPFEVTEHALTMRCAELRTLVAYAYELPFDRVNGPEWIAGPGAPRFDVHADFPDGARDYQIPRCTAR